MKKILAFFIALLILNAVTVYAQTMSNNGYPSNYDISVNPAILSVNNMLSISFSDLGLNYGENNDGLIPSINNNYLDTDNGFIDGGKISITNTYQDLYINADFSYYSANDTFNGYGQSISGAVTDPQTTYAPFSETSSNKIYDFNLKLGYMFPVTSKFVLTPYGEMGYNMWNRGDNTAQYAHYSNWSAIAGILAQYAITRKLVADADLSYGTTFDAKSEEGDIASGGAYYCQNTISSCVPSAIDEDSIVFDLGSKPTYGISGGLDYRFNNTVHVFGNINYKRVEYGQSSAVGLVPTYVYNNGVLVSQIPNSYTEPNSVTNEIIYSVGIGFSF